MISIFDMFKPGIGPSSSHTVGPMKAGKRFIDELVQHHLLEQVTRISADIYGSLSLTGIGHRTDSAIILGLAGNLPESVDIDSIDSFIQQVEQQGMLPLMQGRYQVEFTPSVSLHFHNNNLPLHENGLQLHAWNGQQELYSNTYYSIGGGFIVDADHFFSQASNECVVPYSFRSASELLQHCQQTGLSLSAVVLKNELAMHSQQEITRYFNHVWQTMQACIERGMNTEGMLPGVIKMLRRAPTLHRLLRSDNALSSDPMNVIDWINMFALAVSEENAAGGRVVTAPTNGACGIVPAVLAYYNHFVHPLTAEIHLPYFLAAGAIGILYKLNASISGAEVGCQGEVGVACSMAAAGLTELLGGSPQQVCIAAEIGMEHNLGLTCDPVAGLVQVPCIERNAIAAVKAINASRMALRRTSEPRVSLDKVIETMYETGKDMNTKYRETSRGGLAIKVQCS